MGLVALVCAALAAWFYPWPEIVSAAEMKDQELFEEYVPEDVSWIEVVRFNGELGEPETIRIRKRNDKWILPAKNNFTAGNTERISEATVALRKLVINDVKEDTQSFHMKYGVVDPGETMTETGSGYGTRITLENRDNESIASLIVGKQVKSTSQQIQHYVRIPGQSPVFVTNFDADILKVDFSDWVDTNPARFGPPNRLFEIAQVDNYRIASDALATGSEPQYLYKSRFRPADRLMQIKAPLELDGELHPVAPPVDGSDEERAAAEQMFGLLSNAGWASQGSSGLKTILIMDFNVVDVIKKDDALANVLRSADASAPDAAFQGLYPFGFRKSGFGTVYYEFESVRGLLKFITSEGVVTNFLIGSITDSASGNGGQLSRFLMLVADVNPGSFPEIEKPEDAGQNKQYLQLVAEQKKRRENAGQIAADLNREFAGWFYVIDEDTAGRFVPDLEIPKEWIQVQPADEDAGDENVAYDDAADNDTAGDDGKDEDSSDKSDAGNPNDPNPGSASESDEPGETENTESDGS